MAARRPEHCGEDACATCATVQNTRCATPASYSPNSRLCLRLRQIRMPLMIRKSASAISRPTASRKYCGGVSMAPKSVLIIGSGISGEFIIQVISHSSAVVDLLCSHRQSKDGRASPGPEQLFFLFFCRFFLPHRFAVTLNCDSPYHTRIRSCVCKVNCGFPGRVSPRKLAVGKD
jgi:hypothetical protein